MKTPIKSYRIWHANRSGSTLLCQLLEDTCIAGIPGEHFTLHGEESLCQKFKVSSYKDLINHIWSIGSTPNGVFADKASGHYQAHLDTIKELSTLKGINMPEDYEEIWSDIFPNCKHIIIIRTNKVRQAVSWWKAIQDNQWHIYEDQSVSKKKEFYDNKYDPNALMHLYKEAVLRDISNQEYLIKHGLDFITVTYEDLINDPLRVVQLVMQFAGLEAISNLPAFRLQRTSSEINEEWVHRFKLELQDGMEPKAWI